jgi:hypothetical protein
LQLLKLAQLQLQYMQYRLEEKVEADQALEDDSLAIAGMYLVCIWAHSLLQLRALLATMQFGIAICPAVHFKTVCLDLPLIRPVLAYSWLHCQYLSNTLHVAATSANAAGLSSLAAPSLGDIHKGLGALQADLTQLGSSRVDGLIQQVTGICNVVYCSGGCRGLGFFC